MIVVETTKRVELVSMKTAIPQFLILVLIVWFGSLQNTHAVNPPPDGGYPLGNTAEGEDALFSLTANGTAQHGHRFSCAL